MVCTITQKAAVLNSDIFVTGGHGDMYALMRNSKSVWLLRSFAFEFRVVLNVLFSFMSLKRLHTEGETDFTRLICVQAAVLGSQLGFFECHSVL